MHLVPRHDLRNDFLFPIESHFNKIFDQFLRGNSLKVSLKASVGYPKMDVYEDEDYLTVLVAVPGLKIDDISVEMDCRNDPEVTISGKSSFGVERKDAKFFVKELRQSSFRRTVTLPPSANKDPVAILEDGILRLVWKVPETVKPPEPKKITIKQVKK